MYYLRTQPATQAIQITVDSIASATNITTKAETFYDNASFSTTKKSQISPRNNDSPNNPEGGICQMMDDCLVCGS